jgi:two-component system sensor histidine kinase CpxA
MKSLFLRIFLSFWLAIALFVVLAILAVVAFRPQRNPTWESLATTALADSVGVYEQGGAHQLRAYLENLESTQHVRAHVFDEQGNEISGRAAPVWLEHIALGKPLLNRDGILFPAPRVIVESRGSSNGQHRYTIALALPQGPRVFFGPHGFPLTGLLILVLSSGLVCYFLSWYLAKPIVRLRAATRQLAAGDLSARAGAPPSRRDEVAGLMRDFDTMAERLEKLVNAQSRLLNDISHELRSPLARLNVALGLARRRSGSESDEMLERIELEASRLNELIGRILTLARLEDGEQEVPRTPVPLNELVLSVAEDAEFEAQARRCHVRTQISEAGIPEAGWEVRGNASLLHSAIENVVRNAIRYTHEGSSVEIRLQRVEAATGPEALLQVTDCGPGVPEDALEKLFEPFYRLDDARGRLTGGVGLGLAIAQRAVRFHGGRVSASNRAEGGLLVEIHLPLIAGGKQAEATPEPVPAGREA